MSTAAQALRGDLPSATAWRQAARLRRTLSAALVAGQTLLATYFMLSILPYHGATALEKALTVLFALLFAWISAGFWFAVWGFAIRRAGGDRYSLRARHTDAELAATPLARSAVVMPLHHEPVDRSLQNLRAVYRSLEATGRLAAFDFFILSDSQDPDVWLDEQAAWFRLCRELRAEGRLYYRRRNLNLGYKSGNIADFLRRHGRSYEYMVVLDADSVMSGETLVRMVQLMEREPQVGIIQTKPAIVKARTAFARFQQFGNRVYGRLYAAGLAALQLGEATYWGHNAILRVRPFMQAAGLKQLRGFGLFRGPILSHDFVEAAYMGRAGYEVWLEPGLSGSYEGSPPSLVDDLMRDRRWAKGNLQHFALLFERGIRLAHRVVFVNGIFAYVASPLWFGFLFLTTVEATRLALLPIDYFPTERTLFPVWPEWHPEQAILLAIGTAVVLFLPKVLAFVDVLLERRSAWHGGPGRLGASILLELLVSTLLAPIRMLAHTGFVLAALLNISLKWAGQNRSEETTWAAALSRHAFTGVGAAAWAVFGYWLKPVFFWWSLPVALPLVLAAPTSVLLSRNALGQWLRRHRLLLVPEELEEPKVLSDLAESPPAASSGLRGFARAVLDPRLNGIHAALARERGGEARRERLRVLRHRCLQEGPEALTPRECSLLAQDRESLRALHRGAWSADRRSCWGRWIAELCGPDDAGRPLSHAGNRERE